MTDTTYPGPYAAAMVWAREHRITGSAFLCVYDTDDHQEAVGLARAAGLEKRDVQLGSRHVLQAVKLPGRGNVACRGWSDLAEWLLRTRRIILVDPGDDGTGARWGLSEDS